MELIRNLPSSKKPNSDQTSYISPSIFPHSKYALEDLSIYSIIDSDIGWINWNWDFKTGSGCDRNTGIRPDPQTCSWNTWDLVYVRERSARATSISSRSKNNFHICSPILNIFLKDNLKCLSSPSWHKLSKLFFIFSVFCFEIKVLLKANGYGWTYIRTD